MDILGIRCLKKRIIVLLISTSCLLSTVSFSTAIAETPSSENDIEEIVVTSQRSLRAMRLEMENSELAVYDIFNEKYAGTDFEMSCTRERGIKYEYDPIPNSWGQRVCRSKISHELRRKQMHDFTEMVIAEQEGYVGIPVDFDYYSATAKEYDDEYLQRVNQLLQENPKYREALSKYNKAKTSYETAKKADMESGNFITKLFKRND